VNRARGVILFAAAVTAGFDVTASGNVLGGGILALVGALYVLLTALSRVIEAEDSPPQLTVTIGDIALITTMIWVTGGINSEYCILYYLPILVAAIRGDIRAGVASCIAIAVLYSAVAVFAPSELALLSFETIRVLGVYLSGSVMVLFFGLLGRESKLCDDLRDTLHHSLRRVAAVYDVAHAANTGADLAGVLSIILDHAARATNAASGSVFLLGADEELRHMASLSGSSKSVEPPSALPIEPAEKAISTRAPVSTDVAKDGGEQGKRKASVVYVPLLTPAGPIGVLSLVAGGRNPFARRHIDFLVSLCSEAALAIENAQLRSELRKLAVTDHLTGLSNRREIERRLSLELERANRYEKPLALLVIDVDDLKTINDEFGHAIGDRVLIELAETMRRTIRSSEVAARIGGDEFAILLPETDIRQAAVVAQRLTEELPRRLQAAIDLPDAELIAGIVGISIGVAQNDPTTIAVKELTASADAALYEAKRRGKGRIHVASGVEPTKALGMSGEGQGAVQPLSFSP